MRITKKRNGAVQLSMMMVISAITQVIAIYKSTVTAANFGACMELDAYHFANTLSTFFLTFISAGITTVLIPSYVHKKDKRAINTFITVIFAIVAALILLMFLGRALLVDILTEREALFREYVCGVMGLTILIQFLPAVLGVTTAYFQTEDHFNTPKIILMLSNAGVAAALMIMRSFSIYEYLWVLLAGAAVQFALDIAIAVRLGFRFFPCLDLKNPEYKKMLRIFFPTVFSNGIYKINTMIDSLLSSGMGVGMLTRLSYANTIIGMVNMLFIGNLTTYAYPKIVAAVKEGEKQGQTCVFQFAGLFHTFICLLAAGFAAVGREFIALFYEHGKFTMQDTMMVYQCMCVYMFGLQNNIIRDMIYRYFYAHGKTRVTTFNSFMAGLVNIVTSLILSRFIGIYGLVLGTMTCGIVSLIMVCLQLKKHYGFLVPFREVFMDYAEDLLLMGVSAAGVLLLKRKISFGRVQDLLLFGCMTVLIFGAGVLLLKRKQIAGLRKKLKRNHSDGGNA